jgi:hypothetical protein
MITWTCLACNMSWSAGVAGPVPPMICSSCNAFLHPAISGERFDCGDFSLRVVQEMEW